MIGKPVRMASRMIGLITTAGLTKEGLSPREAEVLIYVIRGETNAEIAADLRISPLTVKKHQERIFRKLGARNRLAAVLAALERCGRPGSSDRNDDRSLRHGLPSSGRHYRRAKNFRDETVQNFRRQNPI